jgi:DNA-binding transcriptional MerR regulator
MPWKERPVEKLYWTIGEVAAELGVNTSLIRYWEKEVGDLRPRRTSRGDRLFERKDIEQLKRIHHLVKEQGFTLNGAREQLRNRTTTIVTTEAAPVEEVRMRLLAIRSKLLALVQEEAPQQ